MADDPFQSSANWWDSSRNVVRFESRESQSGSSGLTNNTGNFSWHGVGDDDMKPPRSSTMENSMSSSTSSSSSSSAAASGRSSVVFHERLQHQQNLDSANLSNDPNLHMMMGLGLSSEASMDWNQASLMRAEKASESGLRCMLQQNLSATTADFHQETGIGLSNRGFSLDQTQFSPQYSSGDSNITSQQVLPSNFQMDSSYSAGLYGNTSVLQGLLGPESNNQAHQPPMSNFPYSTCSSYGLNSNNNNNSNNNQLHFTNNAPFWNASEPAAVSIKDARSNFFPSLQQPFSAPSFHEQSKNISEVRDSGGTMLKKSGNEQSSKRPRNETPPSPLPAFKVRKEKMGDRITALQQLVSPFGKTDTASVLSEATEYIKFLHEQVTVLSTPYMKSGAQTHHQQNSGKSKEADGPKQDLRSRGLCLVPISSTFPVTHEPTVDFWTPTFGGTYR